MSNQVNRVRSSGFRLFKEEISAISIFEGIKLIDKDGNGDIPYIPVDENL
jgi:hypothetical protein